MQPGYEAFNPRINCGEWVIKGEEDKSVSEMGLKNGRIIERWRKRRWRMMKKRYVAKCGIHMHGTSSVCAEHIPMIIMPCGRSFHLFLLNDRVFNLHQPLFHTFLQFSLSFPVYESCLVFCNSPPALFSHELFQIYTTCTSYTHLLVLPNNVPPYKNWHFTFL